MQTQTPEEARRFLVRYFSVFGFVACLIIAGFIYIKYAIVSTYFPNDPQIPTATILLLLLGASLWLACASFTGRWMPFAKRSNADSDSN